MEIKLIYYDIQHHGDISSLEWLAKSLLYKNNFINISYDGASDECLKIWDLLPDDKSNIKVCQSIPLTWCGPSQITQMKLMLERAIKIDGWQYFINLSGVDFPILSQEKIFEKLRYENETNGKTSFCFGFKPKKMPYWLEKNSANTFFKKKYLRLELLCDFEVSCAIDNKTLDPVRNVMQRRALYCEEISKNKLFVRSLSKEEIEKRSSFWDENEYAVGRSWMVLHRKQVEWLLESDYFKFIYDHLHYTFEPDETLFPTVLFSKINPFFNELSSNNLRYKLGSPGVIDIKDLKHIFTSDACFARKMDLNKFSDITKCIENRLKS